MKWNSCLPRRLSHSILYNCEKWDVNNEVDEMEALSNSTLNKISRQTAMNRPMNRLTISNSPDHLRLNRSADTVTHGISVRSCGNYLRPYDFTIQASSDSRIEHISVSPTPNIATQQNTHNIQLQPLDQQEATPERGVNIIRLNSVADVESCFSDGNEMKCRYCFGGALGWIVKETLISPCWCSGSLAYVHRSCLEKWLTTKKQTTCDLCKYEFITKMKYKSLKEVNFRAK